MLTLFSTPKAFTGDLAVIQRNAIRSWTRLRPACEVILLGSDAGTAEVAAELGVRHVPEIACNEHGTPLVNDIFAQAQRLASHDLLGYVNTDIILLSDFLPAVLQVTKHRRPFLMVGRRWNAAIKTLLDFGPDWEAQLRSYLGQHGELFTADGLDYFVFPRNLWGEIPPFALGRTIWDNWLLYRARQRRAWVIDSTRAVTAVHQNHGYGHHAQGKKGVWEGAEAQRNLELAGGWPQVFSLLQATHTLSPDGLQRLFDLRLGWRHLCTQPLFFPRAAWLFRGLVRLEISSRPLRIQVKEKLTAS